MWVWGLGAEDAARYYPKLLGATLGVLELVALLTLWVASAVHIHSLPPNVDKDLAGIPVIMHR